MSDASIPPVVLHNTSRILGNDPLTIETSPEQWAYAAELEVALPAPADGHATISVELEVLRGDVGIGLLNGDGTAFHVERHVAAEDGHTTIHLRSRSAESSGRVIVRNVGVAHVPAVVQIRGVRVGGGDPAAAAEPTIRISSATLAAFECYEGPVPRGFWVNWLGVMTRADVWPFPPDVRAIYDTARDYERTVYPVNDEHVLDWVPTLQAVLSSHEVFRMVALGAGWGRWLTAGAFAARQRGLRFDLTGVEAEPAHFAWMQQHMIDNDIPADSYRLIHGAASPSTEPCWFPVENPAWYGQSIVHVAETTGPRGDGPQPPDDGRQLRQVRAVPIEDVLVDGAVVDYLHMDIQGTEYDFLGRDPQRLTQLVRMVNIGTHSEAIERRLRALFTRLAWTPLYDVSLGSTARIVLDDATAVRVEFGDGVQVWSNPHLSLTPGLT